MHPTPNSGNLFAALPSEPLKDERFELITKSRNVRIERIVSTGQTTPEGEWYDQTQDEWVALLAGAAQLLIDGEAEARQLAPGDWVFLPAHCRHRVTWTSTEDPAVWLAIHIDDA